MRIKKIKGKAIVVASIIVLALGGATAVFGAPSDGVGGGGVPAPKPTLTPSSPVVEAVDPLTSNTKVLVPVASTSTVPTPSASPVKLKTVVKTPNSLQSPSVFDKKPVEPFKNVVLGGIATSKKDDLPFTSLSGASKKKLEIQVIQDFPTSILVTNLTPNANALITLINAKGTQVNIGRFKITANGDLEIPPLTLETKNISVQIRITVGNLVRTFTVRSIA